MTRRHVRWVDQTGVGDDGVRRGGGEVCGDDVAR